MYANAMEHLIVRLGRRRVLVADVCASADGAGIGYGMLLKRIDKVLWYARIKGAAVFYPREARNINTAVFRLQSDDVEILPRRGLAALWLHLLWAITAPFRIGAPWLWVKRTAARVLLGRVYTAAERSERMPRVVRQLVLRRWRLYRTLREANRQYAARSGSIWKERFRRDVKRDVDAGRRRGREIVRRLRLPPDADRAAAADAALLGIGPDAKVITVHVREAGYRAEAGLRQREWDVLRNARIGTYRAAFAALVERGYTVVRLGDPSMTPVHEPGVIDLARSPRRSEWLEIWCVQRSEFLVGCDSGPSWLAFMLDVPVLTVNAVHFRDIERLRDRFICKRVRDRATGRLLSIAEMLTPDYLRTGLDTARYEHIDNSPKDIRDAVIDMVTVVQWEDKLSPRQRRFKHRLVELAREIPHEWSGLQGIAITGRPRGSLSRPFAAKYFRAGP